MSATDIHPTTAATYNGWANKATWLVNVYLYDYLYSSAVELIETYGIQYTTKSNFILEFGLDPDDIDDAIKGLIDVVHSLVSDSVSEILYDAIEQIDNGRDSMLRAMVCDFVNLSIHDVDTHTLATAIVEQYLDSLQ